MTLLLDTHVFLWFILGDPRMGPSARKIIESPDNDCYLSIASIWEAAIKVSIGKLPLGHPFESYISCKLAENGISILPISIAHAARMTALPFHHRDPFDRLLVAQAMTESMVIVSSDSILDRYQVTRIW